MSFQNQSLSLEQEINEILNLPEFSKLSPELEAELDNLQKEELGLARLDSSEQIDNFVVIIKYLKSCIKARRQKIKSLLQLLEADSNHVKCLEECLIKCLSDMKIDCLETENHSLEIFYKKELVISQAQNLYSSDDLPEYSP